LATATLCRRSRSHVRVVARGAEDPCRHGHLEEDPGAAPDAHAHDGLAQRPDRFAARVERRACAAEDEPGEHRIGLEERHDVADVDVAVRRESVELDGRPGDERRRVARREEHLAEVGDEALR
jgi:hypothetical protein